jgi:beta-glucosidase
MCSYNRVNGDYACENQYLLTDLLKKDWDFKGFVLTDWGGAHSTAKASAAGMDHEEPGEIFFGDELKKAVESGKVPAAEVDDLVHRILRAMFATGVIDDPPQKRVVDVVGGFDVAQKIEEQSAVLLKNDHAQLPLDASKIHAIAVIGPHADVGMISGPGSAQVDPPGGNAIMPPGKGQTRWLHHIWSPTSPLKSIGAKVPSATVQFDSGTDPAAAAALAKNADVTILFVYRWRAKAWTWITFLFLRNRTI